MHNAGHDSLPMLHIAYFRPSQSIAVAAVAAAAPSTTDCAQPSTQNIVYVVAEHKHKHSLLYFTFLLTSLTLMCIVVVIQANGSSSSYGIVFGHRALTLHSMCATAKNITPPLLLYVQPAHLDLLCIRHTIWLQVFHPISQTINIETISVVCIVFALFLLFLFSTIAAATTITTTSTATLCTNRRLS